MSINKIGYTDSYGGLISAEEARHLSQKGKEDSRLERLDTIAKYIKEAANKGYNNARMDINPDEAKVLLTLGYAIVYNEVNTATIHWEIEDIQHSQSSEKSETTTT